MASLYECKLNAILDRLDCAIQARTVTRRPLVEIPTFQNRRLQSVLNAAAKAKLIHRSSRHKHVTHLLRDLQWLRSRERIDFKLAHACLSMIARYRSSLSLSDHFQRVASYNRRRLRSSSSSSLLICM